jgi:hypothetical protein
MVSVGGAIGGVFVAIIAPRASTLPELPIGLVACGILAVMCYSMSKSQAGRQPGAYRAGDRRGTLADT